MPRRDAFAAPEGISYRMPSSRLFDSMGGQAEVPLSSDSGPETAVEQSARTANPQTPITPAQTVVPTAGGTVAGGASSALSAMVSAGSAGNARVPAGSPWAPTGLGPKVSRFGDGLERGDAGEEVSLAGVQHAAAKESVLPREQFPVGRPQNSMSPMRQVAEAIVAAEGARVELRLEPEELGRVRFHMQVSEQGVALQVSADRPETLDLLRRNADQLARYLSEAGYQGSRLDFSDERRSRRARGGSSSGASVAESDPVATPPLTPPAATDGLDLRL